MNSKIIRFILFKQNSFQMKFSIQLLLLSVSVLSFAQSEAAKAKVHVRLDMENPLHTISSYLTGAHFVYAFESDELYRDERISQWMKNSKVGTIRYPGGTVVMAYHWDSLNGIPFRTDSWDPEYNSQSKDPADFMDVDEYIAFCRKVHAEPMIGVNILSGKTYNREEEALEEARRLIKHCQDNNYRVKFWYIGNEGYAKGFSAVEYAEYMDKYAEVLKSVDPDIVIIGDWKLGPIAKNRFNGCIEVVRNSRHIEVLEVHEKWGNEWGLASGHSMEDWKREFPLYDGKLGMYTQRFHSEMDRIGKPHIKFGYNEWGLGNIRGSDKHENALVVADFLIELFRNDVFMANYWNLNMGNEQSRILRTKENQLIELSPVADMFEMFASAMGKRLIRVDCTSKEVYGFSTNDEGDGSVQLFVMNKSEKTSMIEIFGLSPAYKVDSVESVDISGNETKDQLTGADAGLALHPWSFNKISFVQNR